MMGPSHAAVRVPPRGPALTGTYTVDLADVSFPWASAHARGGSRAVTGALICAGRPCRRTSTTRAEPWHGPCRRSRAGSRRV
ncbi:hypothetical protein QJS66_11120 [Kocuria rhizophila]|nr:hypothetical protein QJS66_11120 [Kocuria rhizophila]